MNYNKLYNYFIFLNNRRGNLSNATKLKHILDKDENNLKLIDALHNTVLEHLKKGNPKIVVNLKTLPYMLQATPECLKNKEKFDIQLKQLLFDIGIYNYSLRNVFGVAAYDTILTINIID